MEMHIRLHEMVDPSFSISLVQLENHWHSSKTSAWSRDWWLAVNSGWKRKNLSGIESGIGSHRFQFRSSTPLLSTHGSMCFCVDLFSVSSLRWTGADAPHAPQQSWQWQWWIAEPKVPAPLQPRPPCCSLFYSNLVFSSPHSTACKQEGESSCNDNEIFACSHHKAQCGSLPLPWLRWKDPSTHHHQLCFIHSHCSLRYWVQLQFTVDQDCATMWIRVSN